MDVKRNTSGSGTSSSTVEEGMVGRGVTMNTNLWRVLLADAFWECVILIDPNRECRGGFALLSVRKGFAEQTHLRGPVESASLLCFQVLLSSPGAPFTSRHLEC